MKLPATFTNEESELDFPTRAQSDMLKMLAETYLKLLIYTRRNPTYQTDSTLAHLRDEIAALYKADAEHVQVSFELVADIMGEKKGK